jgi:predicted ester cyclase
VSTPPLVTDFYERVWEARDTDAAARILAEDQAVAQMRFSGHHRGSFRGFAPTGQAVTWMGAAFFRLARGRIASVWVLGDLDELDRVLRDNERRA